MMHLLTNDHGEWQLVAAMVSDHWLFVRAWIETRLARHKR